MSKIFRSQTIVQQMLDVFLEQYKPPVNVPTVDGEYLFVNGGPYDPADILRSMFPRVSKNCRETAAAEIREMYGWDWVNVDQY